VIGRPRVGMRKRRELDCPNFISTEARIETNPHYSIAHFHLSSALAHLGRIDEAGAAAQAGLAIDPRFTHGQAQRLSRPSRLAAASWRWDAQSPAPRSITDRSVEPRRRPGLAE
jgi:hypothetical protein